MKKTMVIALLIGILLLVSCDGTSPAPASTIATPQTTEHTQAPSQTPAPTTAEQAEFHVIKEWTGNGIKTTEPFVIKEKPWAIGWAHVPETINGQSMGILQIMIYDIENPNIPITLAANSMEKGSDYSYIYQTGTFYLTINAANTNWSVKVFTFQ